MDIVNNPRTVSFSKLFEMGRLANCLFQIAATVSYAKKHKIGFRLPEWKYSKYFKRDNFYCNPTSVDRIYNEPTFHYTEIPAFDTDVDLQGYFQSPKHFENINVNELFELKDEYKALIDLQYNNILQKFKFLRTISIHVRRGDYLKEPHLSYHGVLGMDYYDAATAKLCPNDFKNVVFVVFSDDINWCRENFIAAPNIHFVEGNEDIVDLFLMARCNDNIIANSSFSYWGAYLNKNHHKRVIAPEKWFGNAGLDCKDLIPDSWIKIWKPLSL